MKKACVIGWPIAHSRSPLIHGYWLKRYGIDGEYSRMPVEPQILAVFIASLAGRGFEGCNVTIPHKEACFALVIPADEATRRLGVVNTVYHRHGQLFGTSTDGEGFLASLQSSAPHYQPSSAPVMILGAGGSATAIAGALLDAGVCELRIANRTLERAEQLKKHFGSRIKPVGWYNAADQLAECALLVNTTSLGMHGQPPLEIALDRLPQEAVVTDIVYVPLETELVRRARARGYTAVGGLGMLLHQAVRGFELWFGVRPEVTRELHDLVAADVLKASAK